MRVLGLTGSIGMGKSTAARMLRRLGVPVHEADRAVHRLLALRGTARDAVARAFPEAVTDGEIDRQALGRAVFGNADRLRRLEATLHPLVRREERKFLAAARRRRRPVAALDIPLLFETGGERCCDLVVVVSAPAFVQRARVLSRAGMTTKRFGDIVSRQMPDAEKRRRADVVVPTGLGRRLTWVRLLRLLRRWRRRPTKRKRHRHA
jgi:dephospho-CoA kinase